MKKSLRVNEIKKYENQYEDKIFITFDIDWASDIVLEYTLDIIEEHDVSCTFFVTHETPLLKRLRKNPKIELGIHPNFNFLLSGDFRYGKTFDEVIDYYFNIVPDAVSCRCHSLVQSSNILEGLSNKGIKFDLNLYLPPEVTAHPFLHFNKKILRLPHFWEDDIHALSGMKWNPMEFLNKPGLKVFDFHPIHVFLNMEILDRYIKAKKYNNDYTKLKSFVNQTETGTKFFLENLIKNIT
jgi:hypothetical protein